MKQTSAGNVFTKSRMTEKQYRAAKAVNKSALINLLNSPLHYKYAIDHPEPDTLAFMRGRAIHAAILEPERFRQDWIAAPEIDRRTTEGKAIYAEFSAKSAGKEILKPDEYNEVVKTAEAIGADRDAAALLADCTTEKPLFWKDEETGIICKCKVDAMKPGIMIDLKTAANAGTKAFARDCFKYGYDIQAAHYINAYLTITGTMPEWYFIVIEKEAPYAINILKADTGFIDYGAGRRAELLRKLKECRKKRIWTGYGKNELILPAYMEG